MELDVFLKDVIGKSRQHRHFYHFTDRRNLPGIRQHGLNSTREIGRLGLEVAAPGGNNWSREADAHAGMDAYVHLCFFNEHPMEWLARQNQQIEQTVFLRVDPEVIRATGVLITTDVSNKSGVVPHAPELALDMIDLEVIYARTDWNNEAVKARLKQAKLCEILVPNRIELKMIQNMPSG